MFDNKDCGNCEHENIDLDDYPCSKCTIHYNNYWMAKLEPRKPKGIDITMSCGEKHHVDTVQPTVETIQVNGEQIYPLPNTGDPKTYYAFAELFSRITGENWKFVGYGDIKYRDEDAQCFYKDMQLSEHLVIPWVGGNGVIIHFTKK